MKNNIEKVMRNSAISVIAQFIILILQFINRRVFIIFLDIEYLGYQTIFSNIFSVLSIAELGIGNIIIFHLYKEVATNNVKEIKKLMCLYKRLYRLVAAIILILGLLCVPMLPLFIMDAQREWSYLYMIYFLQLTSVLAGYFWSYRRTLFIATQQEYRCVKIDLFVMVVAQILQLATLAVFRNYIVYLCIQLSTSIIADIIIAVKSNKEFPYLRVKSPICIEDIKKRNLFIDIRDFLFHQISYAVYAGTDNIIISAFCGVRNVALYGNYILIQKGVMQLAFYRLLNPIRATIGNIVYTDRSKKELWEQFKALDVFSFFFASYIGLGFWIFYQPVIQIWLGDEYLLSDVFVALFSITIYLGAVFEIVYKYRTVFGDYKQDRNLMILSAILNLVISIMGAKVYGIVGVQAGTLIAFLPIAYGRIRFVVKNYFHQSMFDYIIKHVALLLLVCLEGWLVYVLISDLAYNVLDLLIRLFIWSTLPAITGILIFYKNPYFIILLNYLIKMKKILISKIKG